MTATTYQSDGGGGSGTDLDGLLSDESYGSGGSYSDDDSEFYSDGSYRCATGPGVRVQGWTLTLPRAQEIFFKINFQ